MGIRLKLALLLVGFGFFILASMVWSSKFVLHKTMMEYVDQRDQQRLERLKHGLEVYLQKQSLDDVNDFPALHWRRLLYLSHRVDLEQSPGLISFVMRPESNKRRAKPLDEFESRVTLLDAQGQLVFGEVLGETRLREMLYQGDKLFAQLGYHPLRELTEQADIQLADSQAKWFTLGAVFIVLIALVVLWPMVNHFLSPVHQLSRAVHRLSEGEFSERVEVNRQDELGRLQRDFNYLAKTLESAQESRNQWVADISHELRTPLTVIKGSLEAMQDGIRPLTQENVLLLQQEVVVLHRLIEDLYQLSLSDVGALQYSMKALDLSELVTQSVEMFQGQCEQKSLDVQWQICEEVTIEGDETRLNQLLANLLTNSCNYTDAGGKISVNLASAEHQWLLTVEDSAPSVSEEALLRLSERFYRGEMSRNRSTGGAGLGLAIVMKIVQAHGGHIEFAHSQLGGLKVEIGFPKEQA